MNTILPDLKAGEMALFIGAQYEPALLELTAVLSLKNPLFLLDGNNSLNICRITNHIQQYAPDPRTSLKRIHLARATTASALIELLTLMPATAVPHIALHFLANFYNESIHLEESYLLARQAMIQLNRLRENAPIFVNVMLAPQPERLGLIKLLADEATHVYQ